MRSSNKERKIRKLRTELDCCCVATLNKLNNILVIGRHVYIALYMWRSDFIYILFVVCFFFFFFVDAFIIHIYVCAIKVSKNLLIRWNINFFVVSFKCRLKQLTCLNIFLIENCFIERLNKVFFCLCSFQLHT